MAPASRTVHGVAAPSGCGSATRGEYLSKRAAIAQQIERLDPPTAPMTTRLVATLATLGDIWQHATLDERQVLLRELIERVSVTRRPDGTWRAQVEFRPQYAPFFS